MEPLLLSADERQVLERWTRRATSAQALALRSRIVLACAGPDVPPIVGVARELGITADTVRKWRRRFLAERLDGLVDEPRPGRPPTIAVEEVEAVVVATLEEIPKNATHWSRKSMADRSGLSRSTVGRIWRKFQLKPHLSDTFKLSAVPVDRHLVAAADLAGWGGESGRPSFREGRPDSLQPPRCLPALRRPTEARFTSRTRNTGSTLCMHRRRPPRGQFGKSVRSDPRRAKGRSDLWAHRGPIRSILQFPYLSSRHRSPR